MTELESMQTRHSVRRYKDVPLSEDEKSTLLSFLDEINGASGMHFQLVTDEPRAFSSFLARYGKFVGVSSYFALVGAKCKDFYEKIGYYGEHLVMQAHKMGLHTCWAALTYKRIPDTFSVEKGERFAMLISVGHGKNKGLPRRSKKREDVSNISAESPEWFVRGVDGALSAPTAMNQQKFKITLLDDGRVRLKAGFGFYTRCDLGIVRYHFEMAAGKENFEWEDAL